jgi:hypothetical protein
VFLFLHSYLLCHQALGRQGLVWVPLLIQPSSLRSNTSSSPHLCGIALLVSPVSPVLFSRVACCFLYFSLPYTLFVSRSILFRIVSKRVSAYNYLIMLPFYLSSMFISLYFTVLLSSIFFIPTLYLWWLYFTSHLCIFCVECYESVTVVYRL